MSTYKPFLAKDIKVIPFIVNKEFSFDREYFNTSSIDEGTYKYNVGIDRFLGKNLSDPDLITSTDPTTGEITTYYQKTIYNSIKELYYSNFLTSSWGDPSSADYQKHITGSIHTPNYYNYLSSTLTASRYFPTASDSEIGIISIPVKLYGEFIQPQSFIYTITNTGSVTDDGEGNLIFKGNVVGNIIYEHGIAILTSQSGDLNPSSSITNPSSSISFISSYILYETQYKCTVRESEFNYSLNPTLSTSGSLNSFATGSNFSPYITSIGLYDDGGDLLAIAKLSQPIQSSPTTDTTFLINIDM